MVMPTFSRRAVIGGFAALAAVAPRAALLAAESGPVSEPRVGLSGYDPVAYFTDGHPEKGSAEFTAAFDGTTYRFKNAEHKALFVADPDHYAPRFNGYCTVMVSRGIKYEANPELWKIADGKLWVFGGPNAASAFGEKKEDIIAKATENWPEVREKPVQLPQ
jgi:YHS domain-containing protein